MVRLRKPNVERLEGKGDVEGLAGALADNDDEIAIKAARSLGRLKDTKAYDPLLAAALGKDEFSVRPKVRHEAVAALGELGDQRAVEPLIERLKTTWEWIPKVLQTLEEPVAHITASKRGDLEFELILAVECFALITALEQLGDPSFSPAATEVAEGAKEQSDRCLKLSETALLASEFLKDEVVTVAAGIAAAGDKAKEALAKLDKS